MFFHIIFMLISKMKFTMEREKMSTSHVHAISSVIRNHNGFVNSITENIKSDIPAFINNSTINNVIHAKYDGESLEVKLLPFNLTLTTSDNYKATLVNDIINIYKVIEFNISDRDNFNIFNLYIDMEGGISFPNPGDNFVDYHEEKELLVRHITESLFEQLLNKEIITPNVL